MMRVFRIIICILFALTFAAFGFLLLKDIIKTDRTYPEITVINEILDVSLDADEADLFQGVSAYDKKDGDITDKIIIESISKFKEGGTCDVVYAVCDNDNHVATAKRQIRYIGYTSPKITMNSSLCFSIYERIDISGIIGAVDCIDGDISDKVIITSVDYATGSEGIFSLDVKVTNSRGETVSVELPIIVENRNTSAPKIELTDYILYVPKGTQLDFSKYVKSVKDSTNSSAGLNVYIESNYNPDESGVYMVNYYSNDSLNRQGHSTLNVIVEE